MAMLASCRKKWFPSTKITYTFPVRGHSFLPADRAFGRVSKDIKCHETILLPKDYYAILEEHGVVMKYGKDWVASDFKAATKGHLKPRRPFQISNVKRMQIKNDKVGVSDSFSGDFQEHSVLRPGKSWSLFLPPVLESVSTVKENKKADVEKLLLEMGVAEEIQSEYDKMLVTGVSQNSNSDSEGEGDSD